MKSVLFLLMFIFGSSFLFSQEDAPLIIKDSTQVVNQYNRALKPAKSGFYSAIIPGLGQIHSKYAYIKIPAIYAGLGTTIFFYVDNNTKYQNYRSLFKQKKIDEEATEFTFDYLERGQELHKKQRDLSMLLTAGIYILQVVWASVDAHLEYHNTNPDLSFKPSLIEDPFSGKIHLSAGLNFNF